MRCVRHILLAGLLLVATGAKEAETGPFTGSGSRPTEARFLIFVVDIDEINATDQNFVVNVYIRVRWVDPRLTHPGPDRERVPLEDIWNPRIVLANRQGLVRLALPEVAEVAPDGTVSYYQGYAGPLSQPMKLDHFPRDQQHFSIQFAATGYTADELTFVPDTWTGDMVYVGGTIADELSLPDWKIISYEAHARPFQPVAEGMNVAGFAFDFVAKRYFAYYWWQIIVPLGVVVGMSWAAFWIDPKQAGAQIGVASSSILTLIAYRLVLSNLLPRLPYMTRMDYLLLGSTLLVFLALAEVLTTSTLARHNRAKAARRVDGYARAVFPATFVVLVIITMFL